MWCFRGRTVIFGSKQAGRPDNLLSDQLGAWLLYIESWNRTTGEHRDQDRFSFRLADPRSSVRNISRIADHAVLDLEGGWSRADIKNLVSHLHKFLEIQGAIIKRAGKAKPVFE